MAHSGFRLFAGGRTISINGNHARCGSVRTEPSFLVCHTGFGGGDTTAGVDHRGFHHQRAGRLSQRSQIRHLEIDRCNANAGRDGRLYRKSNGGVDQRGGISAVNSAKRIVVVLSRSPMQHDLSMFRGLAGNRQGPADTTPEAATRERAPDEFEARTQRWRLDPAQATLDEREPASCSKRGRTMTGFMCGSSKASVASSQLCVLSTRSG